MMSSMYIVILYGLLVLALLAFLAAVATFVAMLVRWKTPKRRIHVRRLLVFVLIIPIALIAQQFFQWRLFIPSLAKERLSAMQASRLERERETSLLRVGDSVPGLTMTTITGDTVSIPNGKVMVINFFATWCGPCLAELPQLEKLWLEKKSYDKFGLVVIGRGESEQTIRAFLQANQYTLPVSSDPDSLVYSKFASELIPRTLVLSPSGKIIRSTVGFLDTDVSKLNEFLDEQLRTLSPSDSSLQSTGF